MLTQLRADPCQKDRKFERLGDIVVRTGIQTQNGIRICVVTRQHEDRALDALLAHQATEFAAVRIRQSDVQNDQIIKTFFGALHSF